jgi:hypothetical protein
MALGESSGVSSSFSSLTSLYEAVVSELNTISVLWRPGRQLLHFSKTFLKKNMANDSSLSTLTSQRCLMSYLPYKPLSITRQREKTYVMAIFGLCPKFRRYKADIVDFE